MAQRQDSDVFDVIISWEGYAALKEELRVLQGEKKVLLG